jgi:chemotaxis regulatin CheY-phosphate phosphatase CheZ
MTKGIHTKDILISVNNDTEALKRQMQYYINLIVNNMTSDGKTALDAVEDNQVSSDAVKEEMRTMIRQYNGFTGEEIRIMQHYILNN